MLFTGRIGGRGFRLRRQASVNQILFVPVAHGFLLLVQTLPGPLGDREGFFQNVVAKLRPRPPPRWIDLWSVRKHWLHLLQCCGEVHDVPENRACVS